MAASSLLLFLFASFVARPAWAMQFTADSPCSAVCMARPLQNASDPAASNMTGSDIVCGDADYENTDAGARFKLCMNCLQNSTMSEGGESDLGWYLYNLRYAFSSCIFGYSTPSKPISTPCSTDTVCAPMQAALEIGLDNPSSGNQYSYCSMDQNSFLGSHQDHCVSCFKQTTNEVYFSNFITALQAGCVQRPATGSYLGLDGTIFSKVPINITSPMTPNSSKHSKKVLSIGAIIGVSIAAAILLLVLVSYIFICRRKRETRRRERWISTNLDAGHGDKAISVPTKGAYAEPPPSPPVPYEEVALRKLWNLPQSNKVQPAFLGHDNPRSANAHYARQKEREMQDMPEQNQHINNAVVDFPPSSMSRHNSEAVRRGTPGEGHSRPAPLEFVQPTYKPAASEVSPLSPPRSGSTAQRSSSTTTSTFSKTKGSPILPSGLPKAYTSRSNSNSTLKHMRPKLQTRDLSLARESMEIRGSPGSSPSSISGPLVSMQSRIGEEDDALQREKLRTAAYNEVMGAWSQEGLSKRDKEKQAAVDSSHIVNQWREARALRERDSEESIEKWPGGY